jgi:hypothetical protein
VAFLFEELVPLSEEHLRVGYVGTFIFHSDLMLGAARLEDVRFAHLDSSYLIYSVERYGERLKAKQGEKIKAEGHHRIFYLPEATFDQWQSLLFYTYPRNELVAEHLTGQRQSPIG